MFFVANRPLRVARLEHGSPAAVPLVEGARVRAVEITHAVGDPSECRPEHEVVVGAHQAGCLPLPLLPERDAAQAQGEVLEVGVVPEDRAVVNSTICQVVDVAGVVIARVAADRSSLAKRHPTRVPKRKGV
jgi:hypothetical protein